MIPGDDYSTEIYLESVSVPEVTKREVSHNGTWGG